MPGPTNTVTLGARAPHFYPPEERDAQGNITREATYAGLMVTANIQIGTSTHTGPHCVDLPFDATDDQIKAALLTQYGVS